jgi:hypothetical protein
MRGKSDRIMDFSVSRDNASDLTVSIYLRSTHVDGNKNPSFKPARLFSGCNE